MAKAETVKPGRPPLDGTDPSVQVCVSFPSRVYDHLYKQARQERLQSVPELIRRRLGAVPDNKNI